MSLRSFSFLIGMMVSASVLAQTVELPRKSSTGYAMLRGLNPQVIFKLMDANADGKFDEADIALLKRAAKAELVAGRARVILRHDLNGDGIVTREEVIENWGLQRRICQTPWHMDPVQNVMNHDTNKDGRITWDEIMAPMREGVVALQPSIKMANEIVALSGGKVPLKESEFAALIAALTAEDAPPSRSRQQPVASQHAPPPSDDSDEPKKQSCTLPSASANAKVLLLSAYEADSISTTTLGSQNVETRTAAITVEPGEEPLYIVVTSHRAAIWRFTGAVHRIERLVLSSGQKDPTSESRTLVGATGIDDGKVAFVAECFPYIGQQQSDGVQSAIDIVRRAVGREPTVASTYAVSGFSIPSAEIRRTDRNENLFAFKQSLDALMPFAASINPAYLSSMNALEAEAVRFYPGGVVEVDPLKVVSSALASRYDVLPGQAGLLQLVRSGALTQDVRVGLSDHSFKSYQASRTFTIRQKIRLPAGLYGAHSVKFVLGRGVPLPDGDPGHSCVLSEETGQKLGGGPCR